ncbi:dTDP-glucose 4,6-dehydratase [Actinoplanes friuliensis]|uniref:dTDP-glucose 4,6-dehydratase n=1 Tax=Actinoplanes friuliensis DSM 7358 TaxID=1246995 RepID=U5W6J1_9ACTN|nr:NAD-dependent epimerase/dehydratase family protein [Actinoplanes friuliensis]AGZ43541.1 dTDP-glucose 4,6-dehydratase [Actinoplanes friuliensis DSM 7358]
MNLLVTGGAGFIGSCFVRTVLADALPGLEDARITVFDKLTEAGHFANLGPVAESKNLDFVPGDICDEPLVNSVLPRHDAVVNFAAEPQNSPDFTATNVLGTQVLLDAALRHGVQRFVQVSTAEVYGPPGTGSRLAPHSPYAATKAAADLLALAFHRTHGLPVVVIRGAGTYGPYQHPSEIIPRSVTDLLEGRPAPLNDGQPREWLHVTDHCRATALVLLGGTAGEIYHVGGTQALLADRLLDAFATDTDQSTEVADQPLPHTLDDSKIREELGYRPQVDFTTGLADTIQWYRNHEDWWRPLTAD